jgi:hypothetical protein
MAGVAPTLALDPKAAVRVTSPHDVLDRTKRYRYAATIQSRGLTYRSGPEPPRTQSNPPSPNLHVQPSGNVQLVSAIEPPPCRSTPRPALTPSTALRAAAQDTWPRRITTRTRWIDPPSCAVPQDLAAVAGLAASAAANAAEVAMTVSRLRIGMARYYRVISRRTYVLAGRVWPFGKSLAPPHARGTTATTAACAAERAYEEAKR